MKKIISIWAIVLLIELLFISSSPAPSSITGGGSGGTATSIVAPNLVPAGAQFTDKGGYGGYNLTVVPGQLYFATATTNTTAYGLFIVDGTDINLNSDLGPVNGASAPTPILFTPTSSTIQLANDTVTTGSANQIAVYAVTNNLYGNLYGNVFASNVVASTVSGNGTGLSNIAHVVISDDTAGSLNLKDSTLILGFGNGTTSGSSDSLFHVQSLNTSPYNSGSGINYDITGVNPATGKSVVVNTISSSMIYVNTNKFAGILPGNLMVVCNQDPQTMKGFSICAPGLSQLDDGNSSLLYAYLPSAGAGLGTPLWVKGVWQPNDVAYSFTVSGVTTAPNVNDIYTNNNQRFTIVRGTSIVAGSGTIYGTVTTGGAPTASGTLKRMTGNGAPGDATITFSASAITGKWIWAFYVNPVNGYVQVASNLYVTNIVTAYNGIQFKEGSNARMGTATLNGTTAVVVNNTSVTANSRIILTINLGAGTVGSPYVSARSAGTSFSIKSTTVGDTSTVAWVIYEPAS